MRDVVKTSSNTKKYSNKSQRTPQVRKKKKHHRKNLTLYYFTIFVVVTCALVVLSLTVFFKVDKIVISGSSSYSKEELIAYSGIKTGDNLLRVDLKGAGDNILRNLTNIDVVNVTRKLPSEINIEVKPCEPAAVLEINGLYYVISKNGKIIEDKLSVPKEGLIIIKGFEIEELKLNTIIKPNDPKKEPIIMQMLDNIKSSDFYGINEIDITDRLNISLNYENRIDIEIGSSQDLDYKINFVKTTIDEKTTPDFKGKIIMRGNNGASIMENE